MSSSPGSTPSTRPPAPDRDRRLRPLTRTPPCLRRTKHLSSSISRSTAGPTRAPPRFPLAWSLSRPSPHPSRLPRDPPSIRRLARRAAPSPNPLWFRGRRRCPAAGPDSMVQCKAAPGRPRYRPNPSPRLALTLAPSLNHLPCRGPGSPSRVNPAPRRPPTTPSASSRSSPYRDEPRARRRGHSRPLP